MGDGLVVSRILGVTVVSFRDQSILDGAAVERLADTLYELVDAQARRMLLLDFRQVKYLSSTMMGVLLALHKKARAINGQVVVCGLNPSLRRAIRFMRIDSVLNVVDSEQQAMSQFKLVGAAI